MNIKPKIFRILLIVSFLISFQKNSFSNENDSKVDRIFTLIYNQQFTEAELALNKESNQMEAFYRNILNLDLYWWKYSLSGSKEDALKLKKVLENFSRTVLNSREDDINELIRISYQMRYEIKRYNLIGVLILRSDARPRIENLKKSDLSFLGNSQKLFGLYLSLFDYFDTAINPFSFGGNSEKFTKSVVTLEKYSLSGDLILSTIAHYFLGRIYMKVEKQPERGMGHFKVLSARFPENQLFKELAVGLNPEF